MEYWIDERWYVGRPEEVPCIFSQGESLEELEENIRGAYRLMTESELSHRMMVQTKEISVKRLE